MIKFLFFLMVLIFWTGSQLAYAADPDWGGPAYQAPSMYAPDLEVGNELNNTVVVVFHGFKSAMPNKNLRRVRNLVPENYSVVGINYGYFDVQETAIFLRKIAKKYFKNKRVIVLGTSLGGFWANWLGHEIDAEGIVLVNPVLQPQLQMLPFVGLGQFSERRGSTFDVTPSDVAKYATAPPVEDNNVRTLLILVLDDKTIDPAISKGILENRSEVKVVEFEIGGHTVDFVRHAAGASIVSFLYELEAIK